MFKYFHGNICFINNLDIIKLRSYFGDTETATTQFTLYIYMGI